MDFENYLKLASGSIPVGAVILIYLYFIERKIKDICQRQRQLEEWFVNHLINKANGGK